MANYFFRNTGDVNFSVGTNWSLISGGGSAGVAPGVGDTAIFDANSGNCTVDAALISISVLRFTNYANALTMTNNLTVTGNFEVTGTLPATINTGKIFVGGGVSVTANVEGSSHIEANGTGTWSGTGTIRVNFTINTAGTITVSGVVVFSGGATLTYTAGTVVTTGSTLTVTGAVTLNTSTVNWDNVDFVASTTMTLSSNFLCNNFLLRNNSATFNGNTIEVKGNLTINSTFSGTTAILLSGTGIWSGTNDIRTNLTINSPFGTITVSGTVSFGTGTMVYTAGTVITSGSTLNITLSCTLNCSGIAWNNFSVTSSLTVTLSANLVGVGTFTTNNSVVFNTGAINWSGSWSMGSGGTVSGTSIFTFNGTGTWTSSNEAVGIAVIINTSGSITMGSMRMNAGSITYVSGTYVLQNPATNSITILTSSTGTLNIPLVIPSLIMGAGSTMVLNSKLSVKAFSMTGSSAADINGSELNVRNSFETNVGGIGSGTANIVFSGSIVWSGTGFIRNSLTIDCDLLTVSGTVGVGNGTFRYIRGKCITTGATLNLGGTVVLRDIHKIHFANVTFDAATTVTTNSFLEGLGSTPCRIRPASSGNLTVNLTTPWFSEFISLQNVVMGASSPYRLQVNTILANKGGNSGVIFRAHQNSRGLVNEDEYRKRRGINGYVNNFGQLSQGLVRNT